MTSLASIFKILDKLENVESRNSFPLFCRDKGFFKNFLLNIAQISLENLKKLSKIEKERGEGKPGYTRNIRTLFSSAFLVIFSRQYPRGKTRFFILTDIRAGNLPYRTVRCIDHRKGKCKHFRLLRK